MNCLVKFTKRFYNSPSSSASFGFKTVNIEEKQRLVSDVFDKVAGNYDCMNDAMSLGTHRLWKDYFVNKLDPKPGTHILDMAGGTGDIAQRIITHLQKTTKSPEEYLDNTKLLVCDINPSMLKIGRERLLRHIPTKKAVIYEGIKRVDTTGIENEEEEVLQFPQVDFLEQNAEDLKDILDCSFDAYTISFGIRNVPRISKALAEAFRVLKKGGVFFCMEFSHVQNPIFASIYDLYSWNIIPELGQFIAGDKESYQYLVESIKKFPDQEHFKEMLEEVGFKFVKYDNLFNGIVAIHSAIKLQ